MSSAWTIGLGVAALLVSAAGAGLSYYGQQQQAQNASAVANYNAKIQQQNADMQTRMAAKQYEYNALQRNTDQQFAQAKYQQGINNSISLKNQATAQEAQGREQARRMRENQERMLGLQRAKFAKSGVVNEGSPLAVLADTARLTELNIQDTAHQSELERQQSLARSDVEKFQAGFSLLNNDGPDYTMAVADSKRRIAYREADLTRMAGESNAQGYRIGATSSLISGAGQMINQGSSMAYKQRSIS